MPPPPNRFDKHARKVLAVVWVVTLIAGVALLEWMLTPGGARHRSSPQRRAISCPAYRHARVAARHRLHLPDVGGAQAIR